MPTTRFTKMQLSKEIIHLNSFTMSVFVKQIVLLLILFLLLLPLGAWRISASPFPGREIASLPNVLVMAMDSTVWGYRTASERRKGPSLHPIPSFLLKSLCACPSDGTSITRLLLRSRGHAELQTHCPLSKYMIPLAILHPRTHQIRFLYFCQFT